MLQGKKIIFTSEHLQSKTMLQASLFVLYFKSAKKYEILIFYIQYLWTMWPTKTKLFYTLRFSTVFEQTSNKLKYKCNGKDFIMQKVSFLSFVYAPSLVLKKFYCARKKQNSDFHFCSKFPRSCCIFNGKSNFQNGSAIS